MKTIIKIRRWTWEFLQSLLGAILLPFYNKTRLKTFTYKDQEVYIYDKFPGGISLGYYVLLDYNRYDWDNNNIRISLKNSIKHEAGHGIQSKWLGPLYLPFVGLLSGLHNLNCKRKRKKGIPYDYYKFFVEAWADKLGGVKRNESK